MKRHVILFFFFVYFLINYYIFSHLLSIYSSKVIEMVIFILLLFLSTSFLIFVYVSKKIQNITLLSILYKIATGWMIIVVYAFFLFILIDLLHLINLKFLFLPKNTFTGIQAILIVSSIIIILLFYGYLNYFIKRRVYLDLSLEKPLKKPLKIVAISDMHLGYAIQNKELKRWVKKINKEKADLLLIAGDIIDYSMLPVEHFKMYEYFKDINTKYGIYSVLGNHDYIAGVEQAENFMKKAGINLLKDSSILIDDNIYIVGRDDKVNSNRKSLSQIVQNLNQKYPIILLDHQPYHLEEAENKVDLQISGHTHKGQIWPFSIITDYIYEKSHGYLKKGNSHFYISSGLGIWGARYRIGTQSEYIVIQLS